MRVRRPVAFLVSTALAITGLGIVAGPVSAASTWAYPSSPDCPANGDHGLQDCIDNAQPGDTIVLTNEINPDSGLIISKSITLKGIDSSLHPQLIYIAVQDLAGPAIVVTIKDVVVAFGIDAYFDEAPGSSLTISRVQVGKGIINTRGIVIAAAVAVSATVQDSYSRTTDHQRGSLEFYTSHSTGTSQFRAVGNRLTQHGGSDSGSGISVEMTGGGTTTVDLDNNSIWDVVGDSAGGASGIFVYPDGASRADINVVGNTLDLIGSNGIYLRNGTTAPGHVTMDVFNNIVSRTTNGSGLNVSDSVPSTLSFRAGYNAFYANHDGTYQLDPGVSAGSNNIQTNPRFVNRSTGDLRLRSSSPLIDRGQACTSGGLVNLDAGGNGRLFGKNVDMGAYERGSGLPTGVVRLGDNSANSLTGTKGRDILCGFGGTDTLNGRGGADYLDGGSSADKLIGGTGSDLLFGGSGNDTLCAKDGTNGNDYANGGSGSDRGQRDSGDTQVLVEGSANC